MKLIAGEELRAHHIIGINPLDGKAYESYITESHDTMIGATTRTIKKDKTFMYNPSKNTKDVVIKSHEKDITSGG